MKKKVIQRVLSAILCAAMVFQSVSYEAMATETSQTIETAQTVETDEASETDYEESSDTIASDDEATTQIEDSSNEESNESSSENEDLEGGKTPESSTVEEKDSENTTETETTSVETETETVTETEIETETETETETAKIETYSDETINFKTAFPDENFRSVVAKEVSRYVVGTITADTETVSLSDLQQITSLSNHRGYSPTDPTSAIKSIKGIELLTNLESLLLRYHEIEKITDIDWSKLTKLQYIFLDGNNLTELPSFSSNTNLVELYLNENLLNESAIAEIKKNVPSGCELSVNNQRVSDSEFQLVMEDTYYIYNGKSLLFVQPTGYKSGFANNVVFNVDGKEVAMTQYYTSYFYNNDAKLGKGSHTIKATVTYNDKTINTAEYSFNVSEGSIFAGQTKYYAPSTSTENIFISVYSDTDITITKAELIDSSGRVYAENDNIIHSYSMTDPRYEELTYYSKEYNNGEFLTRNNIYLKRTSGTVPYGTYSVRITYGDGGNTYTFTDLVEITADTIITSISQDQYDLAGDYIYIKLEGSAIKPEKLNYFIKYDGVEYKAEYVNSKEETGGVTSGFLVKLKKPDGLLGKNDFDVDVNITDEDGSIKLPDSIPQILIRAGIYWVGYNKGTKQLEVALSKTLNLKGNLKFEVRLSSNGEKVFGTAASLKDDGIAYINVGDWVPEKSTQYYVYCYTDENNYYNGYLYYFDYTTNESFTGSDSSGVYRKIGINSGNKNLKYPIQLSVYRPYDTDKIVDITVKQANSDEYYYWSASEVYNKLPNKDDLYDLIAVDASGQVIKVTNVLIGYNNMSKTSTKTWTATISKNELTVGETADITVKSASGAKYSTSNSNVVTVDSKGKVKAVGVGSATITVTANSETKTLNVTVTPSATDISVDANYTSGDVSFIKDSDNIYIEKTAIRTGSNSFTISAKTTADGATVNPALSWTTSNKNVATVNNGKVTVLGKAGTAKITVKANDGLGKSASLTVTVGDYAPKVDVTSITVYTKTIDKSVSIPVYANSFNNITSKTGALKVKVGDSESKSLTAEYKESDIVLTVKDTVTSKTTEKVKFEFETEMGTCETNQISVTIDVAKTPTVTFKQNGKINLFYAKSTLSYTVTSKNQIENVELGDGNDATFSNLTYDGSTVTLNVDAEKLKAYKTNKQKLYIKLKITVKDYGTFTQDVLVSTENKPVTLTASNASVVPGQTEFTTTIVNSKTKETVTNISKIDLSTTGVTYNKVNDGIVTLSYSGQGKAVNYTAKVSSPDWTADVTVKGKVTYVANPKLVLASKTAIISDKARTSKVSVSVKDCSAEVSDVTITAKDSKTAAYTDLSVKFEDQSIVATLAENATLTKGTYSYTLTGKVGEKDVKLDFKVSVLDARQTVTAQLKSKGTINLVNSSEYITLTPTLKNTTAKIASVNSFNAKVYVKNGKGEDVTDQFRLEMLNDGTLMLGYDEGAPKKLIAKTQYEVTVNFNLDDGTTVAGTVKVTPVIKLPTVKADVSKGTLYNSNSKAFTANITSTSKTGTNAISKVVFDTTKIKAAGNKTADELFNISFVANKNNPANGTITMTLKEDAKNMNLNLKNCAVTALVYYESGTTDASNTPVKVKFTITVK